MIQWLFIGAGNMASSLVGGLTVGENDNQSITIVDPNEATCEAAKDRFDVEAQTSIEAISLDSATDHLMVVIA